MGTIWLLSLPDVLRGAGLRVVEHPGWETRARSSGGYDAVLAVQVHHTASKTSPENDQAYIWHNADSEPIGACYLGRDGVWTVGCAGATNTSGSGGPLGAIPLDAANRYVISVEAANDGVGEPWPWVQTDSYLTGVTALCAAYGLSTRHPDVHSHKEWTSRKIDPAGPSPWAQGSASWNMDAFRADLGAGPPPPQEDDVLPIKVRFYGTLNVFLYGHGGYSHISIALDEYFANLPTVVSEYHPQAVKSALAQSGLTEADLVPHHGEP